MPLIKNKFAFNAAAAEGWKVGGAECSCIAGTRTVRKAHSEHASHALLLGGSGGMPPQENFEK